MFGKKPKALARFHRRLQFEILETRNLLSASPLGLAAAQSLVDNSIVMPASAQFSAQVAPLNAAPDTAHAPYVPWLIRDAYGFDQLGVELTGAGQTIAIIVNGNVFDRFATGRNGDYDFSKHLASLQDDLHTFDVKYNIPDVQINRFTEDNAPIAIGAAPDPVRTGWELEAALDVEWAHAIAPGANIDLFEATTGDMADMIKTAGQAANTPGVTVVSMSFSGHETSMDLQFDASLTTPAGHAPVTFIAASGDHGNITFDTNGNPTGTGGAQYPAASPNVLAVGGTNLTTYLDGHYYTETGWSFGTQANGTSQLASGGGVSQFESQPSFQSDFFTSSKRTTPDVAYNGDLNTPVTIFETDAGGWTTATGTSAGTPQWAGLIAIVDQGRVNHNMPALTRVTSDIYALSATDFHDITTGNNGFSAQAGYDLVTGRGTPKANLLVPDLIAFKEPIILYVPPTNTHIFGKSQNTGNALPATPFSSPIKVFATTDMNCVTQLAAAPTPVIRPSTTTSPLSSVVPFATQPIDFSALLATVHSDEQVDRLIDSLFDFGNHTPTHSNLGTNHFLRDRR